MIWIVNWVRRTLVVLLLPWMGLMADDSRSDSVTLTFAPLENVQVETEFQMTTEIDRDGEVVARYRTLNRRTLEYRREGEGWALESKAETTELEGGRNPVEETVQKVLLGQSLTYILDSKGSVLQVIGFDDLDENLDAVVPEPLREPIHAVINKDSQTWKAILQYQSTYGDLAGKTVELGDSWETEEQVQSPFGPDLRTTRKMKVAGIQEAGDLELVLIHYHMVADTDAFLQMVQRMADDIDPQAADLVGEIGLQEVGERIFDAATLSLLSERTVKVLALPLQLPDGSLVTERRVERQTRTFTYPTLGVPGLPAPSELEEPLSR